MQSFLVSLSLSFMHFRRILPQLVAQRSPNISDLRVAEAQLYHFLPGDPCEYQGRPDGFLILVKLVALLVLPRIPRLWPASKQHSNGGDLTTSVRFFVALFEHCGTSRASNLKFAI